MSKREINGAPETLHMRRVDLCIKAHPETIAKIMSDPKKIFKILMEVESV
jgi:hypothetical protein